jgi:hypothetical protein
MLDRLAVEFQLSDLPRRLRPSALSQVFNSYCHIMEVFGPPKRLLLINRDSQHVPVSPDILGWTVLRLLEHLDDRVTVLDGGMSKL